MPVFRYGLLPSRFLTKIVFVFLNTLIHATCFTHHHLDLIVLNYYYHDHHLHRHKCLSRKHMLTNADCNNESLALHFVVTYSLVTICFSVHTARQLE
jgi:hypothetical protein